MQLRSVKSQGSHGAGIPVAEAASEEVLRLEAENERLQARLQDLGEASLRISVSLDLDSVLQGIIDGARSLADARYGALITFDASGQVQHLLTSGNAAEEFHLLAELPRGQGLLGYLNEIDEPLRLGDIASHPRSGGFPPGHPPMKTFLGNPILHPGGRLGNIYLTEKRGGGEFTSEDEGLIVAFSKQAAMAIVNARHYRELQQAQRSLETLIEISPVGIMLYDAKTLDLLSLNPEVRRIVRGVRVPGRSFEEVRSVIDVRHPDGREIEIDQSATERARRTGETVRSEEVVLHLPDGQTVTTLNSAAPIYSEDGEIASVVTIIQDMTPLADLERARAQFLRMVSQELRTPLTTIKGATAVALNSSPAPDAAEMQECLRIIDGNATRMRTLINNLLDITQIEVGVFSVDPRPADLAGLVEEAKGTFLRSGARNSVEVEIPPDLPRVQAERSRLVQVLGILLSNASTSSPDWSVIRVSASVQDTHVSVSVSDEGWGVSAERLPHFFKKLPRPEQAGPDSVGEDRWLGMAICKGIAEAHGGRIWAESKGPGSGTRLTFTIPTCANASFPSGIAAGASTSGKVRILVADDEPHVVRTIQSALLQAGYETIIAISPGDVVSLVKVEKPNLALLNPELPGINGTDLTQCIGETPVVLLFSSEAKLGKRHALAAEADDYIVKPFSPNELITRVDEVLGRRHTLSNRTGRQEQEPYLLDNLKIDYVERRVTINDCPVRLTATEYELLRHLSVNAGRVLSHEQLLRQAWGADYPNDSRLLRSFIKKLRRKLGDDADNPVYIFTEPRAGYRMAKPGGGRWRSG